MENYRTIEYSVASATIAGELFKAREVANRLSLVSKNSKAMVLRAGSHAAGLRVLSDFFADLAITTIRLSGEINLNSVNVANSCVALWRHDTFCQKLKDIIKIEDKDSLIVPIVKKELEHSEILIKKLMSELSAHIRVLQDYLDDIEQQMQASNVVAVNFRLEAIQTGDFQPLLNNMAQSIDALTNKIKEHVKNSQKELSALRSL